MRSQAAAARGAPGSVPQPALPWTGGAGAAGCAYSFRFDALSGSLRTRLPLAAKTALQNAGSVDG